MIDPPADTQWPLVKRLFELWNCDPDFRKGVEQNLDNATKTCHLCHDSKILANKLWRENSFLEKRYLPDEFPQLHAYLKHQNNLKILRNQIRTTCTPSAEKFKKWRTMQINRCTWQLEAELNDSLIHMPICFELSRGCSVGCSFCGLNAPRLGRVFPYSQKNSRLWREILTISKELIGSSASHASLFWATEPFDNPDYEHFCQDFHSIYNVFPQTTTALALADINRTRELLHLAQSKGTRLNRFSVRETRDLHALHGHFSAEELANVELVLLNRGSKQIKAKTGRLLKDANLSGKSSTISCATGFLVNMAEKTIRLISPWPANSLQPNGYATYAQGKFTSPKDFSATIKQMISTDMQCSFSGKDIVRLTPGVDCYTENNKAVFSSKFRKTPLSQNLPLPDVDSVINGKARSAGEIALYYLESEAIEPSLTFITLNHLLQQGVVVAEMK